MDDHGEAGRPGVVSENSTPDVGVILRAGMAHQDRAPRHIGISAGSGAAPKGCVFIHIGVIAGYGVIKQPGVITCLEGQVALGLYKPTQVTGLDLAADVPQGTDPVEEGIFLMGDIRDLVFLIGYVHHLLLRGILSQALLCVLLPKGRVNVGKSLGAVKLLCHLARQGLQFQHPGP